MWFTDICFKFKEVLIKPGPCFSSWHLCNAWTTKRSLKDDQETKPSPSLLIRQQSSILREDLQVDQEGLVAVFFLDRPQPSMSAGNLAEWSTSLWTAGRSIRTRLTHRDVQLGLTTNRSGWEMEREVRNTLVKDRFALMTFQRFSAHFD